MKCPNKEDLEGLIYALTNPNFDNPPEKPDLDFQRKELIGLGFSEKDSSKLTRLFDSYEDDVEAYSLMSQWGEDRRKAIKNYKAHFKKPCLICVKNRPSQTGGMNMPPRFLSMLRIPYAIFYHILQTCGIRTFRKLL